MTLEEATAKLEALGRPVAADIAIVADRHAFTALRAKQAKWDADHPELAKERARLLPLVMALREQREAENTAKAEAERILAELRGMAGERVAEAIANPGPFEPFGVACDWLAADSWVLCLIGEVGVGKSVGAGLCAFRMLEAHRSAVWLDAREAGEAEIWGDAGQARSRKAQTADLLVIDDLGTKSAKASELWAGWVDRVLAVRHAWKRRTVVTSNADEAGFRKLLGARMWDRIREGGQVHDFAGESLRRPA